MIETMVQWKAFTVFGVDTLASTICYSLNFLQEMKRAENPFLESISPGDLTGKTKLGHYFFEN